MRQVPRRAWLGFVLFAAILWHILAVLAPPQQPPKADSAGRDYASYHYAAQAAAVGFDPWDRATIEDFAQAEGTRGWLHPYLYPAPFLLIVVPFAFLPLGTAFAAWGILQELALVAAALALAWGWRGVHGSVGVVFVALAALMYGVAYGVELGQANMLVLALVIAAVAIEPEDARIGGGLLGLACMLKMSPALVALWWLVRGRRAAVGWAVGAGFGLSILALMLVGPSTQLRFFTEVMPRFSSGDYNGLDIRIGIFGNHSLPSLFHDTFGAGVRTGGRQLLSPFVRVLSSLCALGLVVGAGLAYRRTADDTTTRAGQFASVLVAMLLIPVYTYEHHLVFALPAMTLSLVSLQTGRLPMATAVPVGLAVAVLCYPLPDLKQFADKVVTADAPVAYALVRDLKTVALITVGAAAGWVGTARHGPPADGRG